MFTKRLSIKITFIVLGVFCLGACGGSGKFSGEVRLSDSLDNAVRDKPFYRGNDTITGQPAELYYILEFGTNSSIKDCQITFVLDLVRSAEDKKKGVYKFRSAERKDMGSPCRGVVDAAGTIADIEITDAQVKTPGEYKTYEVSIHYKPVGSTKLLYYDMRTGTQGWF